VARVIRPDQKNSLTNVPGTLDFMPPEAVEDGIPLDYGTDLDVFSFGAVMLHTATQEWPTPQPVKVFDAKYREPRVLTEIQRRQAHLDKIVGATAVLKPLIVKCLNDDPAKRPSISDLSKTIEETQMEQSPVTLGSLLEQATKQVIMSLHRV